MFECLTRHLVPRALEGAGVSVSATEIEVLTEGSSCLVAIAGPCAVRISRTPVHGEEMQRTQRLVDSLPELPFEVPRSMGPAVEEDGIVAVPTRLVPGEPHAPLSGAPEPLRELLEVIHALDVDPASPDLAERHAFMGGSAWESVMRDRVVPTLPATAQEDALATIDAVASLPEVDLVFSHGDLAGSNIRWADGRVVGVIDWDLATYEDPAEDVASLAAWHGWDLAGQIAPPEVVERAQAYKDLFPLQLGAFEILQRDREQVPPRPADGASASTII